MEAKIKKLHSTMFTVNSFGETHQVVARAGCYEGGRTAIVLKGIDGSPFGKLTVNIPECPLEPDEILVKTWAENEGWAHGFLDYPFFADTGKRCPTGFVEAEIWRFAMDTPPPTGTGGD